MRPLGRHPGGYTRSCHTGCYTGCYTDLYTGCYTGGHIGCDTGCHIGCDTGCDTARQAPEGYKKLTEKTFEAVTDEESEAERQFLSSLHGLGAAARANALLKHMAAKQKAAGRAAKDAASDREAERERRAALGLDAGPELFVATGGEQQVEVKPP